jgi:hypothetical protein
MQFSGIVLRMDYLFVTIDDPVLIWGKLFQNIQTTGMH